MADEPTSDANKQQADAKDDAGNWWVFLSTPSKNPNKNESYNHKEKCKWPKKLWFKIVAVSLSDWLMVLFTGVIAFYAYSQYSEMHNGSQQTDKIIAADERIAKAMENSVTASSNALNATIAQNQLDQRAWVGPTDIILKPMHAPDSINAVVTIKNSGKTPALRMGVRYFLHATDVPLDVQEYAKNPIEKRATEKAVSTLFPNAAMELVPATGSTDALGIQSVQNGRKLLYLFVWISYWDVFNAKHETRLCAQWRANGSVFAPCTGDYDYSN